MLAVVGDPDLVGHQRFEVGQQVRLTTFLELPLAFPAQDQQGLGQLLQIRPDGAVAWWPGAAWLQAPQIAQQGRDTSRIDSRSPRYLFSRYARTAGWALRNRDFPLSERTRSTRPA